MTQTVQPRVVDTLEEAIGDAEEFGVGVWGGALEPAEVKEIHDLVWAAANTERAMRGVVEAGYDRDSKNIRVYDLLTYDDKLRELAFNPNALRVVEEFLGPRAQLSNFNANITGPGSMSMYLHADQGFAPEPWADKAYAVNTIWAIDEFTDEVGATRFVPGSHLKRRRPDSSVPEHYDTVPILGPAGSMVILDGRTWHTSGPNTTEDRHRIAIFGYYVRPWVRAQLNWATVVSPELTARLSESERLMLGIDKAGNHENLFGHASPTP